MAVGQAVVVAVHRRGQVDQGLAGVPGREALPQLVVLDERPRQVAHDVDADRDRRRGRAAAQTIGRPSSQPGRSQPSGAGAGGSRTRMGSSGARGPAMRPVPDAAGEPEGRVDDE